MSEVGNTPKKGDVLSNMILLKMEREIPLIDTPQNREILKDYYYSQAESYGIGYLYADYLFKKFYYNYFYCNRCNYCIC